MTLAGPFELIQGGTAVIGRLPVFGRDGDFWGFTIALIRLQLLLGAAEINQLGWVGFDYELARVDPGTGARRVFAGSRNEPLPTPEEVLITVPNGRWVLGVAPRGGWAVPSLSHEGSALVLLLSLVGGLLAMTLLRRPAELRGQVARRRAALLATNRTLEDEVDRRDRIERALRRSEERLRRFIEYAGDAVFLHDTEGRLLNVNREACHILGHERDTLLALPMARIASGFNFEEQQQARAALQPGAVITLEDRLRCADHELRPVDLRVAAFESQGRRLYVSFARDITERLASEAALSRTRNELEERVAQRTAALEQANASLIEEIAERREAVTQLRAAMEVAEEADAAKSRFLANLSHEIRAPMNGLLGMLNLLADHPLTDAQRDYVTTAIRSGDGLLQLLNDLLDLARIEAGYLELDPVETELRPWLEGCVAGPRAAAAGSGIGFAVDVDPALPAWTRLDAPRLAQVLFNLLDNAVKFTASGEVALRLARAGEDAAPRLRVTVNDTGVGIPPESLERIFDAFAQVEETLTRRHGGPGLGLAISDRLVGIMGGRLEVESTVGVGSRFTFDVPLEACAAPVQEEINAAADAPGAPTVLVAEDDHTSQQVVLAMLQRLGCHTELAADGREAVAAFAAGRFDLVLMDCRMPELDGFAAAGEIRRLEEGGDRRTPILGLSGDVDPATVSACRAAGMDGHLGKPLQLAALRETLARWVARWRPAG
jgi:PAS domain S-box-containing protein